ncbi:MAG: hypothetical protein IAI50_19570 [Candidatus Eremiobacteraeota bacterium]|nr:hypothetical protein [Candidatus Eremiobacteraeota bacterium]
MDAAADYAAAVRALAHRLPAYVSYAVHSHVLAGPIDHSENVTIVVRSSDGKIVRGKPPIFQLGSDSKYDSDVVLHPPFDPACYAATGARGETVDGVAAEAITLSDTCKKKHENDGDFGTLYVDAGTHEPLAAVGTNVDETVYVRVQQHFARAGAYLLPAAFDVRVKGSGMMFWLDITGHQGYDSFVFSDKAPA